MNIMKYFLINFYYKTLENDFITLLKNILMKNNQELRDTISKIEEKTVALKLQYNKACHDCDDVLSESLMSEIRNNDLAVVALELALSIRKQKQQDQDQ